MDSLLFRRHRSKIIFFVIGFIFGLILGNFFSKETIIVREGTPDTPAAMTSVNLMIDFGNGSIRTWNTVTWHESQSVLDLLAEVASVKEITLLTKENTNKDAFPESINEIRNDTKTNQRWQYWVNNTYEPRIPSKYFLKPGDMVIWKYTQEQGR